MTALPVSVIVVSRGRPESLRLTLLGLSQLQYPEFEIVVVADPGGGEAAQAMPFADALKIVGYDEPNISAARNLGLAQAAGEVVAFIDDDAVPEPAWLHHLAAPAAQADVAALGGYVRGRNGISYQWKAQSLDMLGEAHPLNIDATRPTVLMPAPGTAIKTEGTNMAFRRDVLVALGGFDPAFAYYLDETDLNLRLARAGHATALIPLAEVHHGYAANRARNHARVPIDLFDVGASTAVFQRKHLHKSEHGEQWDRVQAAQRHRLMQHMVAGRIEPFAVNRLMRRLQEGYEEGRGRLIKTAELPRHALSPFRPFPAHPRPHQMIVTRPLHAKAARGKAARAVADGAIVTLLELSTTALYHRLRFHPDGYWQQTGGLFGKSVRSDSLMRFYTRKQRAARELARIAAQRGEISRHSARKTQQFLKSDFKPGSDDGFGP